MSAGAPASLPPTLAVAALRVQLAASHFEQVLAEGPALFRAARDVADWPQASDAALAVGRACSNLANGDEALRWTHEAALAAQRAGDAERECLAWSQLAAEHGRRDRLAPAIDALDEVARRLPDVQGVAALRELLSGLATTHYGLGLNESALALYDRALQLAEQEADLGAIVTLRTNWLVVANSHHRALRAGEGDAAAALGPVMAAQLARLQPEVERLGAERARWRLAYVTGSVHLELGHPEEASRALEGLLADAPGLPPVLLASVWLALARARRESYDEAGCLEAACAAEAAVAADGTVPRSYDLLRRAEIAELQGRPGEALALFKDYHHRSRQVLVTAIQSRLDHSMARLAEQQAVIENRSLRQQNAGLAAGVERLSVLAASDPLTGLLNRRGFDEACAQLDGGLVGAVVAVLDIDRFKLVNDQHGHAVGDAVLRQVARLLVSALREGDLFARHGGEEFVLLLPGLQNTAARHVLSRMREALAAHDWTATIPAGAVTLSGGAVHLGPGESVAAALERADHLLYQAKLAGRDRFTLDLQP